jgi:hypothetical protein
MSCDEPALRLEANWCPRQQAILAILIALYYDVSSIFVRLLSAGANRTRQPIFGVVRCCVYKMRGYSEMKQHAVMRRQSIVLY